MLKFVQVSLLVLLCTLSLGIILQALNPCRLEGFAPHLDMHANEDKIREEAARVMRKEAEERKEQAYWKDYYERQAREKEKKRRDREEYERKKAEARK